MAELFTSGRKCENLHTGSFKCADYEFRMIQALFAWDLVVNLKTKMASRYIGVYLLAFDSLTIYTIQ